MQPAMELEDKTISLENEVKRLSQQSTVSLQEHNQENMIGLWGRGRPDMIVCLSW